MGERGGAPGKKRRCGAPESHMPGLPATVAGRMWVAEPASFLSRIPSRSETLIDSGFLASISDTAAQCLVSRPPVSSTQGGMTLDSGSYGC